MNALRCAPRSIGCGRICSICGAAPGRDDEPRGTNTGADAFSDRPAASAPLLKLAAAALVDPPAVALRRRAGGGGARCGGHDSRDHRRDDGGDRDHGLSLIHI